MQQIVTNFHLQESARCVQIMNVSRFTFRSSSNEAASRYFVSFYFLPAPSLLPYNRIERLETEDPGDPSWRNGATQGVNPGWSTARVLITLAANAMRRVLITAVVNSRLIYHRYTRYLCACMRAYLARN